MTLVSKTSYRISAKPSYRVLMAKYAKSAYLFKLGRASINASFSVNANPYIPRAGAATLSTTGLFSGTAQVARYGNVSLSVASSVNANSFVQRLANSNLAGSFTVSANNSVERDGSASLNGALFNSALSQVPRYGSSSVSMSLTISASSTVDGNASAYIYASLTVSALGVLQRNASASLFSTANFSANCYIGWQEAPVTPVGNNRNASSVTLQDGKILVSGGGTANGDSYDTYIYDSVLNSWSNTISSFTHSNSAMTVCADGTVVLVPGFESGATQQNIYKFDRNLNAWIPISGTGTAEIAAVRCAESFQDSNGNIKVILIGGFNFDASSPVNKAFILDLNTGDVSLLAGTPNPLPYWAKSVTLQDGKIFLCGGSYNYASSTNVYIYDPALNTWTLKAPMPIAGLIDHSAVLLSNGDVLISGGFIWPELVSKCYIYRPSTNTWRQTDSLPVECRKHVANRLPNNNIMLFGGDRNPNGNKSYIYTPEP